MFPRAGKSEDGRVLDLIGFARQRLNITDERPWRLMWSRVILDKILFEVEERTSSGARCFIGKVAKSEKSKGAHRILQSLWDAGFQPPSQYCVPEPIGYFPEHLLLLQGRAKGTQLFEKIKSHSATAADAARAAEWLLALQQARFAGLQAGSVGDFQLVCKELALALPALTRRLRPLTQFIEARLGADTPGVPSHGDYHPMNLFLDEQQVTAIDIDTFAAREPMFDVGYFVAQTAIMGFHQSGSFAPTEEFRAAFLETMATRAPVRFRKERIRVHVSFALLRSLHYDFCILRANPQHLIDPFLSAAERALSEAKIRLAA
jgi:hypothetical protein